MSATQATAVTLECVGILGVSFVQPLPYNVLLDVVVHSASAAIHNAVVSQLVLRSVPCLCCLSIGFIQFP